MTDTPTSQPDDCHPMRKTWSFSDYGEWLDEGTTALIEDIDARTRESATGPGPAEPVVNEASDIAQRARHVRQVAVTCG